VPFAAVLGPRTLLENSHLKERGFFTEVEQPGVGKLPNAGVAFRMSETPLTFGPAPALGEHTAEVEGGS
jgi:crotonobetainyl-CoA:carnitine CoA-transferase CaiB-like acyl-CoA transferase